MMARFVAQMAVLMLLATLGGLLLLAWAGR